MVSAHHITSVTLAQLKQPYRVLNPSAEIEVSLDEQVMCYLINAAQCGHMEAQSIVGFVYSNCNLYGFIT